MLEASATPDEARPVRREMIIAMHGDDSSSPSPRSASPASSSSSTAPRPPNPRSSTDPSPSAILQGWFKEKEKFEWPRPSTTAHQRNRSPYSRSHLRSRSSGAALLSAPLMTRAHSLPTPNTTNPSTPDHRSGSLSPASNHRSPARARSPGKSPADGEYPMPPPRSPNWADSSSAVFSTSSTLSTSIEAIQEDDELDLTPRPQSAHSMPGGTLQPSPNLALHSRSTVTASLLRRRPASPSPTSYPTPPQSEGSPSLAPQKYNEAFPQLLHHYASSSSFSSIPSTPTSTRSRSPSISSLETIEDAPEQESLALEIERLDRLRLEAERAEKAEAGESDGEGEGGHSSGRRKGSLDSQGRWRSMGAAAGERKRWSVCGGERRGDLDLETIWED